VAGDQEGERRWRRSGGGRRGMGKGAAAAARGWRPARGGRKLVWLWYHVGMCKTLNPNRGWAIY
jgi:hypothetical protein